MIKKFTFAALVFSFLASSSAHASSQKPIYGLGEDRFSLKILNLGPANADPNLNEGTKNPKRDLASNIYQRPRMTKWELEREKRELYKASRVRWPNPWEKRWEMERKKSQLLYKEIEEIKARRKVR